MQHRTGRYTSSSQGGMMRAAHAASYLGISRSTFWRWVAEGRLPKGTHLSARATVWKQEDIERFVAQCVKEEMHERG